MKELLKTIRTNVLITAAAYILFGVVLLVWPNIALNVICYILAGALLVAGVVYMIGHFRKTYWDSYPSNDFAIGLILAIVAILIFWKVDLLKGLAPLFLGLAIIGGGVVKLQNAIDMKRIGYNGWIVILICAVLSVVLGVLVLSDVVGFANGLMMLIGIGMIFSGASDIYTTICVSARVKEHNKSL